MSEDVAPTRDRAELERKLGASQHFTQRVLAAAPVLIYIFDLKSHSNLYLNQAALDFLGYGPDALPLTTPEAVGKRIHPEDLARVAQHHAEMATAGDDEVRELEYRMQQACGQWRWLRSRETVFARDAQGGVLQILGAAEDITDCKRTELSLEQSRRAWEQTFDALPDLIAVLDHHQRIVRVNQAMADRLGMPREQCVGRLCHELLHRGTGSPADCPYCRFAREGRSYSAEISERMLDGDFLISVSPLPQINGTPGGCVHVARDISPMKRVEQSLRESHETLQALLNATSEVAYLIDAQGTIQAFNETLAERLGKEPQGLVGQSIYEFLPVPLSRSQREIAAQVLDSGRPVHFQEMYDERHLEGMAWPVRDLEGRVTSLAVYSRDVTQQRQAEDALRTSEAKFRSYIEHAPLAVFVIGQGGYCLEVNATACAMFGYTEEEFLQLLLGDLFAPDAPTRHDMLERVAEGPQSGEEVHLRRKDGSTFWGSLRAVRLSSGRLLAFIADTTELKAAQLAQQQLQLQLAHMGRVATVGEMIAGIAHEVNQPLYSIVNYAKAGTNLLAQPTPRIEELRECNREIAAAAVRAADIIARLRTFLSRSDSRRGPANLCELIDETIGLVAYQTQHRSVVVHTDFDTPCQIVEVDRVQIQQVLVNLLQNAWEALEEMPARERRVIIQTAVDEHAVRVSISDNGPGLQAIPASRIFDPFVTTKRKGLGVGLSISKTIIQAHGGRIWGEFPPKEGAVFHFTLPLLEEKARHAR